MKYLTLELLKRQLNMNLDYTDEDVYLTHLCDVTEDVVKKAIDDNLEVLADANDGVLPPSIVHAMLLLAATYYSNRENVAFANGIDVPKTYDYLIDLNRNYEGEDGIMGLLNEIKQRLDCIDEYIEFDKNRKIEGEGLDVTTADSGQTTVITIENIDSGEY